MLRSGVHAPQQPIPRGSKVRRWLGHLFREWTIESWRPIAPAFAKPEPSKWSDTQVTLAWLGHSTVLTTEKYLRRLDTTRIYRQAYEGAGAAAGLTDDAGAAREAAAEFGPDSADGDA